jgi:hypothetical protein
MFPSALWHAQFIGQRSVYTGWSKINEILIKIFIDGSKSIQFDWVNKHTILLWLYKSPRRSRHVVTCLRQSVSCLSNNLISRMSFSQVQRVFIVEHYLAPRSYLTWQNEFRDTFPDSPVPNKSKISRLVNRFRDTETLHRVASNMRKRVNTCIAERRGHF